MILVYHNLFNHLPVEEVSSFWQMEIIKLKNTITKIKTQWMGLIYSRVEITEDRINDLKDRSIKFTQFEQQRENKIEKQKNPTTNNRVSGTCGTITKELTYTFFLTSGPMQE